MPKKAGVNMSYVKLNNRALILNQLKEERKSRKDIADKIKLTPAAVTILVNELMQEGCIIESSHLDTSGNVGRKKIFVKLNKDFRYSIGVNIEPKVVSVGIANLASEILKSQELKISSSMPVDEIIKKIVKACMDLLWELNISKSNVLGVGVGIVGIVDSEKGISNHAYGLWKEQVNINELISEKVQLPVVVENNVRALAIAEMELTEHSNIKNMVFFKYGPGIGSAIIINEDVYNGSYNNAGEIGHMIIDPEGRQCKCGQRGCLETVASMECLISEFRDEYDKKSYPILSEMIDDNAENIDESVIIEAYKNGERQAVSKIDKAIKYLALGTVNIMRLYDPNKIIFYGSFPDEDIFMDKLSEEVKALSEEENNSEKIEKSILKEEKCIGGIVLSNKELFFKTGGIL